MEKELCTFFRLKSMKQELAMRGDYGPHHSPLQICRLVYIALKFNICFNIQNQSNVIIAHNSSDAQPYPTHTSKRYTNN